MQLSRRVVAYVVAILLAGCVLTGLSIVRYPPNSDPVELSLFVAFIVLMALAQSHGLHLTVGTRIYVDSIVTFAAVLLFPPGMALLVTGIGFLLARIRRRQPLWEDLFNFGQTQMHVGVGALFFSAFATTPWTPVGWLPWAGVFCTCVVMYICNTASIAGVVGLAHHTSPIQFWLNSAPKGLLEHGLMFSLGLLTATVVITHPWALLLLILPGVAIFIALDRTLQTEARHKQLADQNAELASHLGEQAEQLREAYAVLEDAMDAKSQMLQNVSHELRTPLVSIYGYTEALQEGLYGEVSDNQRAALAVIYRNSHAMIRLVNDLLSMQALDRSQLQLDDVSLPGLFERTTATFAQRAETAGIRLTIDCDEHMPPLRADAARLEQVIGNLVDNAIKFSPNGGDVRLQALSLDQNTIQISVGDQGIGIPEEELPFLYRRFYQVDGSSTRRFGGQGLGLAIAKRIVELHGGGIDAESEVGKGTTFVLTLPVSVPGNGCKLTECD